MFKKIKTILKKKPVSGKEEDKTASLGDASSLKSGKTASSKKESVQKKPEKKAVRQPAQPLDGSKAPSAKTASRPPVSKDKGRASVEKEQVSAGASPSTAEKPRSVSDNSVASSKKPVVKSKPITPPSKSKDETDVLKQKSSSPPDRSQSAIQEKEKTAPSSKAKSAGKASPAPPPKSEKPAAPSAESQKDTALKPPGPKNAKLKESPKSALKPTGPSELKPEPQGKTKPEAKAEEQPEKEASPQRETVKLQGLFAFKQSMTSFYDEKGFRVPVTALKYEPWLVSQIKTSEKEGYSSVQLASLPQKNGRCNRPLTKHLAPAGFREGARFLREIRQNLPEGIKVGQELSIESLKKGDRVQISSRSKGRGFSGTVKRWGFRGGPASHGSKTHRKTGSIGQCAEPARVMPGRKMPGRYGFQTVTLNSVLVVDVLPKERMIFVKGPVSGARNTLVSLRKTGESHA